MPKKKTQQEIINLIKEIHGDQYDISRVEYINSKIKLILGCRNHGREIYWFKVSFDLIKRGTGCNICGNKRKGSYKKISNEEVIERIVSIHGDQYDLSRVNYNLQNEKIIIGCKNNEVHGKETYWFNTRLTQLERGQGCPKCGYLKAASYKLKSFEELINTAKINHKSKYFKRYKVSEESFTKWGNKIKIHCKKHNIEWEMIAAVFAKGEGCRECSYEKISSTKKMTLEEFILKSNKRHMNLYDYTNTIEPNGADSFVNVTCKEHGEFFTNVRNHIGKQGSGCPKCKTSNGEVMIGLILDNNKILYETQKKFEGLKFKKHLRCDFYINHLNLVIEFNGRQHYEKVNLFGGKEALKQTQKLDKLKMNYCIKNDINFEVIRFDEDISERIEEILEKYN